MEVAVINSLHCVRAVAANNMFQSSYTKSGACAHRGRLGETAFQPSFE